MKHKAFRWIPAVLLAALLAGCGAESCSLCPPGWPPGAEIDPAGFHARHRGDHRAVHP